MNTEECHICQIAPLEIDAHFEPFLKFFSIDLNLRILKDVLRI